MKIATFLRINFAAVMALGAATSFAQVPPVISYQGRLQVSGVNFSGAGQFKFAIVSPGTNVSRQSTATVTVTSGFITSATVTDGGAGYTSPPAVTVTDATGSGAVLTANVSGGAVTSITVNNPGAGYSGSSAVSIAAPPPAFVYGTFWSNDGSSSGGSEPANSVNVPVQAGLVNVFLGDTNLSNMQPLPPAVFTQSDVHLRIWFNDGTNGFVQLTPDQRLGAVGYANMAAIASQVAERAINASAIADFAVTTSKLASNAVTSVQIQDGTIVAADLSTGLLNNVFWKLGGNGGTVGASSFLGTTDNQPLEFRVNNRRVWRVESNSNVIAPSGDAPNIIGGCPGNFVASGVVGATIAGGGTTNFMNYGVFTNQVSSDFGTIGGGYLNSIETNAILATIAGGDFCAIGSGGARAAIGGGWYNRASGATSTVPGGYNNIAIGDNSFAAGYQAQAAHAGAFVWADSTGGIASQRANQFRARATGGARFDVNSGDWVDIFRKTNGLPPFTTTVKLIDTSTTAYLSGGGAWTDSSDRNRKKDFAEVDGQQILEQVASLPIQAWSYTNETGIRHIGPMAQDFHAAFGVGADEKSIATLDESGVALAAIQALNQKVAQQQAELKSRDAVISRLEERLTELERGLRGRTPQTGRLKN